MPCERDERKALRGRCRRLARGQAGRNVTTYLAISPRGNLSFPRLSKSNIGFSTRKKRIHPAIELTTRQSVIENPSVQIFAETNPPFTRMNSDIKNPLLK